MTMQPPPERLAYGLPEVAALLSLSLRSIYHLLEAGSLKAVKIGGRRLILKTDLEAFLDAAKSKEAA